MPQFDKVAFFTQIIWSLLVFSSFYALNLKGVLAPMVMLIKIRSKIC